MAGLLTKNGATIFYRKLLIFQGFCGAFFLSVILFGARIIDPFSGTIMTIGGKWIGLIGCLFFGLVLLTKSIASLCMINQPILILSDDGMVLCAGILSNRIIRLTWKDVRTIRIMHEEYSGDSADICCLVLSIYAGRQKPYDKYRVLFSDFKSKPDEVIAAIDQYRKVCMDVAATKHLVEKC